MKKSDHDTSSDTLLGAHTSAAGGVHNALYEGESIGATTIQLFTANQRQWKVRSLSQESIDLWNKALDETGLRAIMSHASYLINLGAPDPEVLMKSREAFREEIIRCLQLNLSYLNFHPGSSLQEPVEVCIEKIIESIRSVKDLFEENVPLQILLEATAGQGSTVGWKFEELAAIINGLKGEFPIGVCIDTCHIFAAGYDIRTKEALDHTLKQFDQIVGMKYLKAFHLNDSQKGLGSRVDRHAPIGEGTIGVNAFKAIMQHPALKLLPKYLETPGGPELWKQEIALLRTFI